MSATISQKVQAMFIICLLVAKMACYLLLVGLLMWYLRSMDLAGSSSWYLISAVIYLRSSLEQAVTADWNAATTALGKLLLECRVLYTGGGAFLSLGMLLQIGQVGSCLQTQVITDLVDLEDPFQADEVGYVKKPIKTDAWRLPFAVTASLGFDNIWHIAEGMQLWHVMFSMIHGKPWVYVTYTPKSASTWSEDEDHFELWSARAAWCMQLLAASDLVNEAQKDDKYSMSRSLLRSEFRSLA
jgi:hypothetical protein